MRAVFLLQTPAKVFRSPVCNGASPVLGGNPSVLRHLVKNEPNMEFLQKRRSDCRFGQRNIFVQTVFVTQKSSDLVNELHVIGKHYTPICPSRCSSCN
jgi:hypothetical protein